MLPVAPFSMITPLPTGARLGYHKHKTYTRLAALTKLSPLDIYEATEHRFAAIVTAQGQELETLSLPCGQGISQPVQILHNRAAHLHFYTASATQYCPLCLCEDSTPYHRLLWSARAIVSCTRHEVILMDECAECHSPVRVRDIIEGACRKCHAEFAQAIPRSVAGDRLGLRTQQILAGWLLGEQPPSGIEAYSLPQASAHALYRVMYGLAHAIGHADPSCGFIHQLPGGNTNLSRLGRGQLQATPINLYRVYATAIMTLMNWPGNFYSFLLGYRTRRRSGKHGRTLGRALFTELSRFYTDHLNDEWKSAEFAFIQEAFDSFLMENQASLPRLSNSARYRSSQTQADQFEYMSLAEVQATLDLARGAVIKLVSAGYLHTEENRQSDNRVVQLIRRTDVLAMATQWKERGWISTIKAAEVLGIDWKAMAILRRAELLVPVRGPEIDGFPIWVYSQDTVSACQTKLSGKITILPPDAKVEGIITIDDARYNLYGSMGSTEAFLQQALSGKYRVYLYSKQPSKPPALYFVESDVRAYRSSFRKLDVLALDLVRGA